MAAGHSHDHHHDHSNCNHDHGAHGGHAAHNKANAANDEMAARQQAADKLAKSLAELQVLANEHKKLVSSKTSNEVVNKADVDLLMKELQLTKAEAEAALRANKSDLVATLTTLIKQ